MSIRGIGLDVVDLERIGRIHAQHGDAFVARLCRPGECQPRRGAALIEHLGGLFAAKEAVMKALGTGWSGGVAFRQVEVVRRESGAPTVRLHDGAASHVAAAGGGHVHLTITHERRYAAAVAIWERSPDTAPPGAPSTPTDESR